MKCEFERNLKRLKLRKFYFVFVTVDNQIETNKKFFVVVENASNPFLFLSKRVFEHDIKARSGSLLRKENKKKTTQKSHVNKIL